MRCRSAPLNNHFYDFFFFFCFTFLLFLNGLCTHFRFSVVLIAYFRRDAESCADVGQIAKMIFIPPFPIRKSVSSIGHQRAVRHLEISHWS